MPPETTIQKLTTHRRRLWCTTLFVRFLVLVLSIAVLVLVLETVQYSNPAHWSASSRELPRSTIAIAAVQKAIEYEYRPPRRTEYEYDEIRCEARTPISSEIIARNSELRSDATEHPNGGVGTSLL